MYTDESHFKDWLSLRDGRAFSHGKAHTGE